MLLSVSSYTDLFVLLTVQLPCDRGSSGCYSILQMGELRLAHSQPHSHAQRRRDYEVDTLIPVS